MKQFIDYICPPHLLLSPQQVRFMLSVADEYELICPAPVIWYNPVTYEPSFLIDRLDQEYRADFLIRNRVSGVAFLVELHPALLGNDQRLELRRHIAESYIAWKGYDWQYQCLFQEYVALSENESLLLDSYCSMQTDTDRRQWLEDYVSLSRLLKPAVFQSAEYSLLDFLIHGVLPEHP